MAYTDINTPVVAEIQLPSGNKYYIADRELRDVVDALSDTVAGGVSYMVAWDGTAAPTVANIPAGITVNYNGTDYTGTLSADLATPGAFYLVSTGDDETNNIYAEYVPVGAAGSKTWEKIGDTAVDLSDYVTNVTLNKSTDTAIGTDATFTITQPTVALSAESSSGTGKAEYIQSVDASKKLSASASGAAVAWNSKDQVTALTGLGTASTDSVIGSDATFTITQPTISLSGNASTATGRVEVADGTGTSSSTNTDWLKGVSVSNGVLSIGAATMDTTYLGATATGANTAWNNKDSVTAVTGYANPSTDTVIGSDSTFSVTQPSVTIASGTTGDVTYVSGGTTKYMGATASGANTAWNSKDSVTVLTNSTDITVTKGS